MHIHCQTLLFLFHIALVLCKPLEKIGGIIGCQVCHALDKDKINVHLVPHSHDDVGWLKTVEDYYYGTKKNIQYAGVQYIISSTVEALQTHPDRRFVQVESAFLWRWWEQQSDNVKDVVRELINNGQLEIINGAWSMNDEATTNYQSTIDQFTWGLRFLNDSFGECARPQIGWQIDPFGHSREHASLLSQMGFQALVIGRIDYRDKQKRISEKNLDFLWSGSDNLNNSIFTTIFPDFYNWIDGFCFDVTCNDGPIVDDVKSTAYNLKYYVDKFKTRLNMYKQYYKTNNYLVPMGGDFNYQAAEVNYANMDKLIRGFEDDPMYNVFYSTPSCYVKAVYDEVKSKQLTLKTKTDDFFPYASDRDAFWTGYFTSRPTNKRLERVGNNILQAAKQLTTFSRIRGRDDEKFIDDLRDAMGIMQHHDAITGTEKQAVAQDYVRMLSGGIKTAEQPMGVIFGELLKKDTETVDLKLSSCLLANVSICEPSSKDRFIVVVYNPLSRSVTHHVRLPVQGTSYKITGADGLDEEYDLNSAISTFDHVKENTKSLQKELIFTAREIPPFGTKLYYIEKADDPSLKEEEFQEVTGDIELGTEENGFSIAEDGTLSSVTIRGVKLKITQEFYYYLGLSTSFRKSGAYTFLPKEDARSVSVNVSVRAKFGKLVDEVHQVFGHEVSQIIRVYKDEDVDYIEFDWLVGDLQTEGNFGKEIITRFTIDDFKSNAIFYTDSNGREQIPRKLNQRSDYQYSYRDQPITSNYYPVTSKIVIKDQERNLEVAVLNDRSQGGSSLQEGVVELMIHRKLLRDDGFGVGEALSEHEYGNTGLFVRGQHYLTFGPIEDEGKSSAAFERDLAHKKLMAPWILLADATGDAFNSLEKLQGLVNFKFQGLTRSLPENVKILTLEPWKDDTYLLRLEHTLEKNEDEKLSQTVTVDLANLFTIFHIDEIGETTLAANQWLDDYEIEDKLVWGEGMTQSWIKLDVDDPLRIELHPMQIRTFLIRVRSK